MIRSALRCSATGLLWCVLGLSTPAFGTTERETSAACPPASHDRATLQQLKSGRFDIADDAERNRLALALLPCLRDPDPALRDGIGFEALARWLQSGNLDAATVAQLRDALAAELRQVPPAGDPGFRQPFAALVLAEVVAADRRKPAWTAAELEALLVLALDYVGAVDDLRGYDEREGWRHGIAHGADLLLQLAAHPKLEAAAHERILATLATRLSPPGHFYIYGEPARLARPLLVIAERATLPPERLAAWIEAHAAPAPFPAWGATYASQAGLAHRHNTTAFLHALLAGYGNLGQQDMEKRIRALLGAM